MRAHRGIQVWQLLSLRNWNHCRDGRCESFMMTVITTRFWYWPRLIHWKIDEKTWQHGSSRNKSSPPTLYLTINYLRHVTLNLLTNSETLNVNSLKSPTLTDLGNLLFHILWQFKNNFTIFFISLRLYTVFNCYDVHIHVYYVFSAIVCLIVSYSPIHITVIQHLCWNNY